MAPPPTPWPTMGVLLELEEPHKLPPPAAPSWVGGMQPQTCLYPYHSLSLGAKEIASWFIKVGLRTAFHVHARSTFTPCIPFPRH